MMPHNRTRKTDDEVHELTQKHNLTWIGGEYKNSLSRLDFEDSDGYRYNYNLQHFYGNKKSRMIVGIRNPHSIHNMNLHIVSTRKPFRLVSTEYNDVKGDIELQCVVCDTVFTTTWDGVFSKKSKNKLCPICFPREYTKQEIIAKVNSKNKKVIATNAKRSGCKHWLVEVECKTCGKKWNSLANGLFRGHACSDCNRVRTNNSYNTKIADRNKDEWLEKVAVVYIVKMSYEHEEFVKIGITLRSVNKRFGGLKNYNIEKLQEVKTNLYNAVYLEKRLHNLLSEFSHTPLIKFDGYTECFSLGALPVIQHHLI